MKYVYFAQAFSGGPIKIGMSANPERRIAALSSCSPEPLDLIVSMPGDRTVEVYLHDLMKHGRLHGEWFSEDTPGLDQLIEVMVAPDMSIPEVAHFHTVWQRYLAKDAADQDAERGRS